MPPERKKGTADPCIGSADSVAGQLIEAVNREHKKDFEEYGTQNIAGRLKDSGTNVPVVGVISTRNPQLDMALGRGGIPFGRMTLLGGNEGVGKTTLALTLCAQAQRQGGLAIYQDMEYKLDLEYAQRLGVDVNELILSQPPHLEGCFAVQETMIKKIAAIRKETGRELPIVIVLDSINSALAKAELDGDYDEAYYAPQARVMSLGLKKLIGLASRERVALVYISQLREDVNAQAFQAKYKTAAGKAPRFYATIIIELTRIGVVKSSDDKVIGSRVKAFTSKNQIAPPFQSAEFDLLFGEGFDYVGGLCEVGEKKGVIEKAGSWYAFKRPNGTVVKWQGARNLAKRLDEIPGLEAEIEDAIGLRSAHKA